MITFVAIRTDTSLLQSIAIVLTASIAQQSVDQLITQSCFFDVE
jgi:hypothetical protein